MSQSWGDGLETQSLTSGTTLFHSLIRSIANKASSWKVQAMRMLHCFWQEGCDRGRQAEGRNIPVCKALCGPGGQKERVQAVAVCTHTHSGHTFTCVFVYGRVICMCTSGIHISENLCSYRKHPAHCVYGPHSTGVCGTEGEQCPASQILGEGGYLLSHPMSSQWKVIISHL